MSYANSLALQKAIYERLSADTALSATLGNAVFDDAPAGELPDLYVTIGDDRVRDRSDQSGYGAQHDITLSVVSTRSGYADAKSASAAVCDAMLGGPPVLDRGRIINVSFLTARARRVDQGMRRVIDLVFRVRVSDE